jgi:outer membrane protein assembly factor BamE (lipoprotein component of BamABCDE complex)
MRMLLLAGLLALSCSGCTHTTGRDFPRPEAAGLIPGKTVKNEVIAVYGIPDSQTSTFNSDFVAPATQPKSEFDAAAVGGAYSTIMYNYVQSTIPVAGGDVSIKRAIFGFRNDTLIAYNFTSNFPTESSDFDESKLSLIQKGKTTQAEIEAMLGRPTGEAVYPIVLTEGEKKAFYNHLAVNMATRKVEAKNLTVLFSPDGRVIDFRFNSRLANMAPAPVAPAPGFVPIVIPVHK